MDQGVPESAILIDPKAPSTVAEIYHTIKAQPWASEYFIATQKYHAFRSCRMFERELKRAGRPMAPVGYHVAKGGTVVDCVREVRSIYRFYRHTWFGNEPHLANTQ
jgi:uncharacterized SAM-binding protein YcdF (DUF218 family)